MLIYFLTIVLLPVLTLGVLGPWLYSREVSNLSAEYTRNLVDKITSNLELTIRDQEKLLEMLLLNPQTQEFFRSSGDNSDVGELADLFNSITESHPENLVAPVDNLPRQY